MDYPIIIKSILGGALVCVFETNAPLADYYFKGGFLD